MLRENPFLGVSARIVEQYSRADGKFFPAAIQHCLGTLDPRIPGLGAWTPIDMSSGGSAVTASWDGTADPASVNDRELAELLEAVAEVDAEQGYAEPELPGPDYGDDFANAAEQFDSAFNASYAATQAREHARAAAVVEDTLHPARRDEDKMARIIARARDGVYDGTGYGFAADAAAVEITLSNGGRGPRGPADAFGRCSSRYHDLECAHSQSVDWLASGPHPVTGAASLSNLADRLELDMSARTIWGDPDGDEPGYPSGPHDRAGGPPEPVPGAGRRTALDAASAVRRTGSGTCASNCGP